MEKVATQNASEISDLEDARSEAEVTDDLVEVDFEEERIAMPMMMQMGMEW